MVVIGVTNEELGLVDEWVAKKKPGYPIVVVKGDAFDNALGVQGFPTKGVIAPDGTLTYAGYSPEGAFKDATKAAEKGSIYPKVLSKVRKALKKGDTSKAYAEVLALQEGGKVDEADKVMVDGFRVMIEGFAATDLASARQAVEDGLIFQAVALLEPIAESKTEFPATPDAVKLLEELEALPDFKDELKGGKGYTDAQELVSEGEYTDAAKKFVSVAKKYEGTRIGQAARDEAQQLVESGMPGFKQTCGDCRKGRRACSKHEETVKM